MSLDPSLCPDGLASLASMAPLLGHSHLQAFSVALVLLFPSPSMKVSLLKVLVRDGAARPPQAWKLGELALTGGPPGQQFLHSTSSGTHHLTWKLVGLDLVAV